MASKVQTDNLTKDEIFQVTKLIYDNNLNWKSEEVLSAWSKTRSKKNEKFSIELREKGNSLLKIGNWNKALLFYNEAVVLAETDSKRNVSCQTWTIDIMAIRVVEFSNGGTKLERFSPKNQHTQRKFLNWTNGEPQ